MRRFAFLFFALFGMHLMTADEQKAPPTLCTIEIPEDLVAMAPDTGAESTLTEDKRLEAYIKGLIDAKYAKYKVGVTVRHGHVILSNLPEDPIRTNKIINYVKKFSSIVTLEKGHEIALEEDPTIPQKPIAKDDYTGTWLPQSTVLFPTQIANPRQISFSVGPRFGDICGGKVATAFSFGDQCPIYRWSNVGKWKGDLQFEVEAGVFCVFSHDVSSFPMQNADYYAGIPLTYAVGPWAFRARFYHFSSHLGDEFMDRHPHIKRKNKSYEAVDFFTSYQLTDGIRLYGGPGVVVHADREMSIKPLYAEYGVEARAFRHNFTQLYGQPFLAMHFRNYQEDNFQFDATYALGYEWGKLQGFGRKIRMYFEYHDGYCFEGQFSKFRTSYFGFKLAYGF